jgi:hypothetical protein
MIFLFFVDLLILSLINLLLLTLWYLLLAHLVNSIIWLLSCIYILRIIICQIHYLLNRLLILNIWLLILKLILLNLYLSKQILKILIDNWLLIIRLLIDIINLVVEFLFHKIIDFWAMISFNQQITY